jgi:hypothetical protein
LASHLKTKLNIAKDWLPRYTGARIDEIGVYILLTNFHNYIHIFADQFGTDIRGEGRPIQTATFFIVGHANEISRGALLLVTDMTLIPEGVKTQESDRLVTEKYTNLHIIIGIEAMTEIGGKGKEIKHSRYLKFLGIKHKT